MSVNNDGKKVEATLFGLFSLLREEETKGEAWDVPSGFSLPPTLTDL